jgi:3-deoxy-D-manno-octulosonic-acid transferase
MPNLAALVDEIREQFPDAKLIYGKDLVTGHEVGKQEVIDPDKVFTIPKDYFPSKPVETKRRSKA